MRIAREQESFQFQSHLIFERDEVLSKTGTPYSVFTPYKRAWLERLAPAHLAPHATGGAAALVPPPAALDRGMPALEAIGFRRTNLAALGVKPGMSGGAALFADFRRRIDRYREATIALGYVGDSVFNSVSDILFAAIGFLFAWRVRPWVTVAVILAMEIGTALWMRDNLTLNIVMLLHPIDAIKDWQMAGRPIP